MSLEPRNGISATPGGDFAGRSNVGVTSLDIVIGPDMAMQAVRRELAQCGSFTATASFDRLHRNVAYGQHVIAVCSIPALAEAVRDLHDLIPNATFADR